MLETLCEQILLGILPDWSHTVKMRSPILRPQCAEELALGRQRDSRVQISPDVLGNHTPGTGCLLPAI